MVPLASASKALSKAEQVVSLVPIKVVAGDDAIDDGNPGRTMGKSEMSKTGTTGPFGTAYLSTGGGALVNATGGLLRITFGRVTGGDFNIGRLLDCGGAGVS